MVDKDILPQKRKALSMKDVITFLFATLISGSGLMAATNVSRESGGSIRTELAYGIVVNDSSSLQREWITIHDDAIPANLVGTTGVKTVFKKSGRNDGRGDFLYSTNYALETNVDIAAIEVRFLTFDIWGDHLKTLSATNIQDMKSGDTLKLAASWSVFSENEVSEFYASIAYIAQLRTKAGRVIKANHSVVLQEAQKFSAKFKESDLEQEPEKK